MNESTVSTAFQKLFRETIPGAVLVKHADKSMIGLPDASITCNKRTLWLEYKFIGPKTKGVNAKFMLTGAWFPNLVAESSPTQADMVRRLARSGHALYIFWVVDTKALKKKVGYISVWHPITGLHLNFNSNHDVVTFLRNTYFSDSNVPTVM